MAISTLPKADLFRFVTLRGPQMINQARKSLGFINHPNPAQSHFLKGLEEVSSFEAAREKIRQRKQDYKPFAHYQDLRDLNPELYEFSNWLMQTKSSIEAKAVVNRAENIGRLKADQMRKVWDSLFFYTIERSRPTVRQACLQLIVAQNLLKELANGDLQHRADHLIDRPRSPAPPGPDERVRLFVKRLAHAKVVLPKLFSRRLDDGGQPGKKPTKAVKGPQVQRDYGRLNTTHFNGVARGRADRLRKIRKELEQHKRLAFRRREPTMAVKLLEDTDNPVTPDTAEFLRKSAGESMSISTAIRKAGDSLRRESARILGPNRTRRRAIVARGHLVREQPKDEFCYSISFLNDEVKVGSTASEEKVMYLTLNAGYINAFIKSTDYSLTLDGKQMLKSDMLAVVRQEDGMLHLRLFPTQDLGLKRSALFEFDAMLELDDGTRLTINVSGNTGHDVTNGCAEIDQKTNGDEAAPPPTAPSSPSSKVELYGVSNIGVAVFRKVEQEVCCYVAGEVSRIENILAREYKERSTRSLLRTELTDEISTETETENISDTATTTRNELQTEVSNVINNSTSTGFGASLGVTGEFPGGSVSADAYADFTSSNSSSVSDSTAKTYAQEITEQALERVVQKVTQKRTSRIIREFEESNKHGFDNREGDEHVTGVYRWVDIIYTNRLVNYGKRLTYEFMIPEPAAGYKYLLEQRAGDDGGDGTGAPTSVLEPPVDPADPKIGITGPDVFDEGTYLEYGRLYGVTIPEPKGTHAPISKGYTPVPQPDMKDEGYDFELMIPPDYEATEIILDMVFEYKYSTTEHNTKCRVVVGDTEAYNYPWPKAAKKDGFRTRRPHREEELEQRWSSSLPVSIECKNVNTFSTISVVAEIEWSIEARTRWQNEAYDLILRAYQAQLDEYNAALADLETKNEAEEEDDDENPKRFNRSLEKREIKRICIEMLTQPFGFEMGEHDFYTRQGCAAELIQGPRLVTYASHVRFFEQAFDWEIMAYLFYPYYWAKTCTWKALLQAEYAPDPIFQAFLQSGMARVTVPVRPGFEEAVIYYMETGDIWNGGDLVLESDDELYLSIADELQQIEGVVEEEWQTRVPTSLTLVQGDSVLLREGGLPCCDDHEITVEENTIEVSTAKLGNLQETEQG